MQYTYINSLNRSKTKLKLKKDFFRRTKSEYLKNVDCSVCKS